jgi:glycosyltransferase involved in cell wall biosynthesis
VKTIPPSVCIVIPAYNAAATIPELLRNLKARISASRIYVVDDGSSDKTAPICEDAEVHVVRHPENRGKGSALKTGIEKVLERHDIGAIVTMDADGQHDPDDLDGFIGMWTEGGSDLVIGQRMISGSRMPLHRRASNRITSFLVSSRTGTRIPDSQCGYRLLSRRFAASVTPRSDGFEAETEWIIRGARQPFIITSTPVRTIYNDEKSHMTNWVTTKAFIQVLLKEYPWAD